MKPYGQLWGNTTSMPTLYESLKTCNTVILSEACFHFLAFALYPSLFCHLHLCHGLCFHLSITFDSFWLASLFSSGLVLSRHNPELAKKFSCCITYRLVEVGDHGFHVSTFIYQHGKRCKSITLQLPVKHSSLWGHSASRGQTWYLAGLVHILW